MTWTALAVWLMGCGGCGEPSEESPDPPSDEVAEPEPAEQAPKVAFQLPVKQAGTPRPLTKKKVLRKLDKAREILLKVVLDEARDPGNPWAVTHAMLVLGADTTLTNESKAVDWLFSEYAEIVTVGETELLTFPPSRGDVRIEPHTDLVLKALTEAGVPPDRVVKVDGRDFNLSALYRHSLWRAWAKGGTTGFRSGDFNDAPWALQGLTAWAPAGAEWVAQGRRGMEMNGLTTATVQKLASETAAMKAARSAGDSMRKDTRRGIFRYTCGGQHLLQGVAYAVGRGFGTAEDRAEVCEQKDLLRWRIDLELDTVDPLIEKGDRAVQIVLLGQRLKFLGHYLETVHKIGALGICDLSDEDLAASHRVATELAATVDALDKLGVFSDLAGIKTDATLSKYRQGGSEQVYLDIVGDAAHAVRGIDMATGGDAGTIRY
ncbi:MAG: hypothetical protein KTR31_15780 [Myxococcales bacterium]|nr:hypothetical protein [Myxococcales bacterium]